MFMKRLIEAVPWRLVGWALLAALVFGAGWEVQSWRKDAEISAINEDRARERRDQVLAQIKAVDDARIEERRRTAAQTEIANAAIQKANAAAADARMSDAAARELRARIAALVNVARTPGDAGAVSGGAPAGAAVDLLADVLRWSDETSGELAEFADRAANAGEACERSYDALRPAGQ